MLAIGLVGACRNDWGAPESRRCRARSRCARAGATVAATRSSGSDRRWPPRQANSAPISRAPRPTLAQKAAPFRDTNATDAFRASSKPAEEQSGAGSSRRPPLPPMPGPQPRRMQAVEVDEAVAPLDSATVRASSAASRFDSRIAGVGREALTSNGAGGCRRAGARFDARDPAVRIAPDGGHAVAPDDQAVRGRCPARRRPSPRQFRQPAGPVRWWTAGGDSDECDDDSVLKLLRKIKP